MDKLKFGLIGTGKIVDTVLEASKLEKRFVATAIYSRDWEKANEFAKKHNIPHRYSSLEAMFSSGHIEAVYIASPTALHFKHAEKAMKYGLHVLCEKALASNAHEVRELIKTSKQQNATLMEAMRCVFQPNYTILKQNMEAIGKPNYYFGTYCQYSSRYDNFKAGIIENAFRPELSNGATMDIGIYTIYPMVQLFGKPSKISAIGQLLHTGVDGEATVEFEYESGMKAKVVYSKIANASDPSRIQGDLGTFEINPIYSFEHVELIKDTKVEIISVPQQNSYYYELKEFIDLVIKGSCESKIANLATSLTTLEVLDEIRKQLSVVFPADSI